VIAISSIAIAATKSSLDCSFCYNSSKGSNITGSSYCCNNPITTSKTTAQGENTPIIAKLLMTLASMLAPALTTRAESTTKATAAAAATTTE
jgi:hypothetical protein